MVIVSMVHIPKRVLPDARSLCSSTPTLDNDIALPTAHCPLNHWVTWLRSGSVGSATYIIPTQLISPASAKVYSYCTLMRIFAKVLGEPRLRIIMETSTYVSEFFRVLFLAVFFLLLRFRFLLSYVLLRTAVAVAVFYTFSQFSMSLPVSPPWNLRCSVHNLARTREKCTTFLYDRSVVRAYVGQKWNFLFFFLFHHRPSLSF